MKIESRTSAQAEEVVRLLKRLIGTNLEHATYDVVPGRKSMDDMMDEFQRSRSQSVIMEVMLQELTHPAMMAFTAYNPD